MAIKSQAKISSASIVPGMRLDLNPFQQRAGTARLIRNWTPERNRLLRKCYAPAFQTMATTASGSVWAIVDFRYHRSLAPESQLLVFRSDGKIYRRTAGSELEVFPGVTSYSVLNARPTPIILGNRLFFSDSSTAYVYDGRSFRRWGIPRETGVLATPSVVAGAGITAAGGLSASITWVVLDEAGNRVHESSRSGASLFSAALANQTLHISIAALTPPSGYGVTHWSAYMSELNATGKRRRVATTPIATTTVDINALPAATLPLEPIRNDPPFASLVIGSWRNRMAMRRETDPTQIWFTAYGEVKSLTNGAADESVCGGDASSVSDLSNEFVLPRFETTLIAEHENLLLCFSQAAGFAVIGTAGTIDNIGTRDLKNEHFSPEGAAGPRAGCSTPFGFAWMTPGRKVKLWSADRQVIDLGDAIQPQLNTIPEAEMWDVSFFWWDGNGRKWLVICTSTADSDDLSGTPSYRLLIYDFDLGSDDQHPGEWHEWTDHTYTTAGNYFDGDHRFLLGGDASGNVYQLDTTTDPSHLNRSMILGSTYLGSSLQDNPVATMRTGLLVPSGDKDTNVTGLYVSVVRGTQDGPSTSVGTSPTVKAAVDVINPDLAPSIALTLDTTAKDSGEFLAWLKPEAGGEEGGALAKQFQFETAYAAGVANNGEVDGRFTVALEALYKLAFSWQTAEDIKA